MERKGLVAKHEVLSRRVTIPMRRVLNRSCRDADLQHSAKAPRHRPHEAQHADDAAATRRDAAVTIHCYTTRNDQISVFSERGDHSQTASQLIRMMFKHIETRPPGSRDPSLRNDALRKTSNNKPKLSLYKNQIKKIKDGLIKGRKIFRSLSAELFTS